MAIAISAAKTTSTQDRPLKVIRVQFPVDVSYSFPVSFSRHI